MLAPINISSLSHVSWFFKDKVVVDVLYFQFALIEIACLGDRNGYVHKSPALTQFMGHANWMGNLGYN